MTTQTLRDVSSGAAVRYRPCAGAIGTSPAWETVLASALRVARTGPPNLASAEGVFIRVDVAASGRPKSWSEPVHAYFARQNGGWKLGGRRQRANQSGRNG
jgi:hypothetical protein